MTRSKKPLRGLVRLQPYVDAELAKRVASYCGAHGISEAALIRTAIRQFLDGSGDGVILLRQLSRMGRDVQKVHCDQELLSEAFAIWVRLWFAHTPAIADDAKRAARVSAEARYQQYVEHLASQFSGGKRFIDDLPKEDGFLDSPDPGDPEQ